MWEARGCRRRAPDSGAARKRVDAGCRRRREQAMRSQGALRLTRSEISGAFAALGLLVPLEAALIAVNGLNPTSTLLGVGILYIGAGWYFGLPMPVQPLKALSGIAIAEQLSPDVIAAGAPLLRPSLGVLAG